MVQYEYDGPRTSVSLVRDFSATSASVFDAWVLADIAGEWLFTTKTSTSVCELEPRVGGSYRITRTRGGKQYVAVGEYQVVDRPRRLVFTFGMPQFAADFDTISVDIEPASDGCRVTLAQDGLRPGDEQSMLSGWGKMFDLLDKALAARRSG